MLVAGVSGARWEKMFAGRPRKPALCSQSLRLSARDMVPAILVGAPSQRDVGTYSIAMRLWNRLELTLDLG